jgi:hypothetical protein
MQPAVQVSLSIDAARFKAIAQRAEAMGHKPSRYIGMLVDAAYLARVQREKGVEPEDRALDSACQRVFLLADCEPEFIAQATGLQPALVERILDGWRRIGEQTADRPAPPKPEPGNAVDKTVRVAPGAGSHGGLSVNDKATIALMWGQGASAAAIGAEIGLDADQVRAFARQHRDLCPARDNPAEKTKPAAVGGGRPEGGYPVETIRRMWAEGKPSKEIAAAIGKTRGALEMWASKHRDVCPHRVKKT